MIKDLSYLVVKEVEENEDGSAEVTFLMDDKTKDVLVEEGLRFVLTCAAAKLDIEYALQILMNYMDDADVE
jgi:hypothetical protein